MSTPVRIAMLAPISWRTPPRHYGPWELVTSLLTEALVARGVDVTLFATADSITAGTLAGVCARVPIPKTRRSTPRSGSCCTSLMCSSAPGEFDLIHNQADFVPARLLAAGRHAARHHHPRLLVRTDRAGLQALQDRVSYVAISEADRAPRASATRRRSIMASRSTTSPSIRTAATTCCSSAASTRQGRRGGDRGRAPRGAPAGHGGHRPGRGLSRARGRARHRRRAGRLRRAGRAARRARARSARRARCFT